MSSDTAPVSFADLKTDLTRRLREVATSGSATEAMVESMLNTANVDIHVSPGATWPWAMRDDKIITGAPYIEGTVSIAAAARTTVTGASTLWNTAVPGMGFNNINVGWKVVFQGGPDIYKFSAVTDDTNATLQNRYIGDELTAATYTAFADEYALAADFARPLDLHSFSTNQAIPLIGPMAFRRAFPRNSSLGKPKVATVLDNIGFSGSTAPRTRIVFGPAPNGIYQIPYDYITSYLAVTSAGVAQPQMTADTDEPIMPIRYRHVIVLHALYNFLRDRKNDARTQLVQAEYNHMMGRMKGDFNIGQDKPSLTPRLGHGGYLRQRFDVGSRFDQIRDRY
jgi:hypothetical protein